jgi:predicted aspartyl protease
MTLQAPAGFAIWRPTITLRSLRVGDAILEDIEAVVSEGVPRADGVLGQNFLRHFHVTIERGVPNLLLLEPRPPAGAPE